MTGRPRKGRDGQLKNALLHCDRGNQYENRYGSTQDTWKRVVGTMKINCPFEWFASKRQGQWFLNARIKEHKHKFDIDNMFRSPFFSCAYK